MQNSILVDEVLQMRIVDLEYEFPNMSNEEIKEAIQRIYLEEKGRSLEKDFDIHHMNNPNDKQEFSTDAKGTALVFKEEEQTDLVFISRGSVSSEDWVDNIFGVGVGSGGAEYARESSVFLKEVEKVYGGEIVFYGLGHSKAHNTLSSMQLNSNTFESIDTFNGAQSNVYQQNEIDLKFRREIINKYRDSDIRSIPPHEIEEFAVEYYKEKGININQSRSTSDFLYALDAFPGMFVVGNVSEYETDSQNSGFVQAVEAIPQEDLRLLSEFLAPFGEVYAEDGRDGAIEAAKEAALSFYKNQPGSDPIDFDSLKSSMVGLVEGLEKSGYLSSKEAKEMNEDLDTLLNSVEVIYLRAYEGEGTSGLRMITDGVVTFYQYQMNMKGAIDRIQEHFEGVAEAAYKHHSLEALMNELSEGKFYQNDEMYLELIEGRGGQNHIKLNLSRTLDAYEAMIDVLNNQENMVETYQAMIQQIYVDAYENKKQTLIQKMNTMESNYRAYQHLIPSSNHGLIENLRFHEEFNALIDPPIEGLAVMSRMNREKIETTANAMREGIELIFDRDHNVAGMFKYLSGEI
ncbi:DUF6792 domain-containing protein [Alkalicoccobacillus porphyridii]|uniref:DUF6792 domain-containing protein n=1 Tax=Alkalicoccobacillus porphyridii TaxID=2597270 RepID=A0A554A1B7_9BACI|nr:DUF6792 domain-containing protein [Alkalicoccobacillus porphyridii]TSB47436.1 hypothetical protein FN960_06790 [Alkalicoccobacillus porphyridii]